MPEGEGYCDGQWHSVTATKLRHRLELVVDEKKSQAESPNARSNTCDTNDPIYVGGYPGTDVFLHAECSTYVIKPHVVHIVYIPYR